MHVNISAEVFEKTFKTYDKNHNNQIDYEEFKQMMIQLSMKKEVIPIFHTFHNNFLEFKKKINK